MTNIKSNIAGCRFSAEELSRMLPYVSAVVKQVMGVANNVVQVTMMNARDDLRKHPQYRQRVKQAFKKAFGEWDAYEKVLVNSVGVCYFHVADMSAEVKKRYTNLTDREYYEFWQSIGYSVYDKNAAFISALDNKFKVSLETHGVPHGELLCKAMTTEQLLLIAVQRYNDCTSVIKKELGIKRDIIDFLFKCFSLERLHKAWSDALSLIVPNFPLDEVEDKNLRMSIEQLYEIIADIPEMYEGIEKATEDYPEVFRTKGEWKKALRQMKEDDEEMFKDIYNKRV